MRIEGFQILPVIHRIAHHSSRDGYDRLAQSIDGGRAAIVAGDLRWPLNRVVERIYRRWMPRNPLPWYGSKHWRAELSVCWRSYLPRRNLFHFIYGEDQFAISSQWARRRDNRFVVTVHQPPAMAKKLGIERAFAGVDGMIVMASNQAKFWKDYLPAERVVVVPHGIDVDYFLPAAARAESGSKLTCITVGRWLRDYDTLEKVIRLYLETTPPENRDLTFRVIGPRDLAPKFSALPATVFRTDISDADLLAELQAADIMLMPLLDCTANTALLEGMACGCPIVASDVGGIRDYVTEGCGVLLPPGDVKGYVETIATLARNPERRRVMRTAARQRATGLSWAAVAEATFAAYRQFIGLPSRAGSGSHASGTLQEGHV